MASSDIACERMSVAPLVLAPALFVPLQPHCLLPSRGQSTNKLIAYQHQQVHSRIVIQTSAAVRPHTHAGR